MGNLPAVRVKPARPFQNTGIDYAGPIMVRSWKGRGGKTWKAYIALFVCLATKAYHLELVSSLATEEFIAALKRFTSRRGLSSNIYSDNGTTFVGANRQLRELGNLLKSKAHQERVIGFATDHEINWHFIPPSAPHFGGIWEAGVRAVKHHLRRQVGNALLTYEELTTLLCQIEAVLNSRPITQQSIGEDDYETLTPGHFLTGAPLTAVLEANQEQKSFNTLSRWQYVQRLHQSFWRRWQAEYLNQLQQRAKWKRPEKNLQPNDIVIIKEDNLPPTVWALGRVLQVHPGKDEKVRVVTLKGRSGIIKRPISKLCLLPRDALFSN